MANSEKFFENPFRASTFESFEKKKQNDTEKTILGDAPHDDSEHASLDKPPSKEDFENLKKEVKQNPRYKRRSFSPVIVNGQLIYNNNTVLHPNGEVLYSHKALISPRNSFDPYILSPDLFPRSIDVSPIIGGSLSSRRRAFSLESSQRQSQIPFDLITCTTTTPFEKTAKNYEKKKSAEKAKKEQERKASTEEQVSKPSARYNPEEGIPYIHKGKCYVNASSQTVSNVATQTIESSLNSSKERGMYTKAPKEKIKFSNIEPPSQKSSHQHEPSTLRPKAKRLSMFVNSKSRNSDDERVLRRSFSYDGTSSKLTSKSGNLQKKQLTIRELKEQLQKRDIWNETLKQAVLDVDKELVDTRKSNTQRLDNRRNSLEYLAQLDSLREKKKQQLVRRGILPARDSQKQNITSPVKHHRKMHIGEKRFSSCQSSIELMEKELHKMKHITSVMQKKVQQLELQREACAAPDPITMLVGGLKTSQPQPKNAVNVKPKPGKAGISAFSDTQPTKSVRRLMQLHPEKISSKPPAGPDQTKTSPLRISSQSAFSPASPFSSLSSQSHV